MFLGFWFSFRGQEQQEEEEDDDDDNDLLKFFVGGCQMNGARKNEWKVKISSHKSVDHLPRWDAWSDIYRNPS